MYINNIETKVHRSRCAIQCGVIANQNNLSLYLINHKNNSEPRLQLCNSNLAAIPLGTVSCYDDQDATLAMAVSIQDGEEFIRINPIGRSATSVFIRSQQAIDFEVT